MGNYAKGMETKDTIIKVARELFYKQGYNNTTTRQIAEISDTNLGLISYYFGNKGKIAATIYNDIRMEMYKPVKSIYSDDKLTLFLINIMIDLLCIFKCEQYGNFYLQISNENPIRSYHKKLIESAMQIVPDMILSHNHEFELTKISIRSMKSEIVGAVLKGEVNVPIDVVIKYFTNQYIISIGADNSLSEIIYQELMTLNVNMMENFVTVITKD